MIIRHVCIDCGHPDFWAEGKPSDTRTTAVGFELNGAPVTTKTLGSTRAEITYALQLGKPISFLEPVGFDPDELSEPAGPGVVTLKTGDML